MPITALTIDPLKLPPSMIIAGATGVGKTTAIASTFPEYFYLLTNPTAIAPIADYVQRYPEIAKARGITVPTGLKVITPSYDRDCKMVRGSVIEPFLTFLEGWVSASASGQNKYAGLAIVEFSTLLDWLYEEVRPASGSGSGRSAFDAIDRIKRIANRLAKLPSETGKGLVCESHWAEMVLHDDESPKRGQVKHPAGPRMPIGTMIELVCKEFDLVWRLCVSGGTGLDARKLYFETQPRQDYVLKTRRFGVLDEEPLESARETIREKLNFPV
jgi:hypothetical protein